MQIAVIWGLAVTLAVYATRHLSCAHLNPAVSVAMVLSGRMQPYLLPWYMVSQLAGAVAAGTAVLLLLNGSTESFEAAAGIVRGTPDSVRTAMMFGEYFPNPGMAPQWMKVSMPVAMLAEGLGTFLLVTMIFLLSEGCNVGRPSDGVSPVFIGGTVAAIIAVLAPLTQAGITPARDFGPRLVAYFAGWGAIAIPGPHGGFFPVYIAAPFFGGAIAAGFFKWVVEPLMRQESDVGACSCRPSGSRSIEVTVAKH